MPIGIVLLPVLPLLLLLTIPTPWRAEALCITSSNWGNIASVWGLGVSIYLISIARGARRAALDARSGEKARSALQDLREAAERNTQLGMYARSEKWDAVQLRAEEVMKCCHSTVARWREDPAFKESSNHLLIVAAEMHSIIIEAAKSNIRAANIIGAQVTSSEKLSAVIGRVQKEQDSRSE